MNISTAWNNLQNTTTVVQKEPKEQEQTDRSEKKAQKTPEELTPQERQQVAKLQARDTEVKAHEAAHKAAGGGLAGSASFEYQKGPDGKMYAVGGEVPISFKKGSTPEETIANARQVRAAALAPANPSPQDFKVASSATMMELKAQQEKIKEQLKELQNQDKNKLQKAYGITQTQEHKPFETIA